MPTVKEAFEAAKAKTSTASTEAPNSQEKTDEKIEELKAQYEKEISELKKNSENYQTEALKLRQDLSENIKFTQSLLEKDRKSDTKVLESELSDEELLDALNTKPNRTLKALIAKEVSKAAEKYEGDISKLTTELSVDSRKTKVQLAKRDLMEKYSDVDKDWDKMVEFGDKYYNLTQHAHDPKHLEAYYLMYKNFVGETPKKREGRMSEEAIAKLMSKKLAAGLDSSVMSDGETITLTPEQQKIADRYGMTAEAYKKYSNPMFSYNDYKKAKGGK